MAECAGTREIHRRMSAVYDGHCMSLTSVHYMSLMRQAHRAITPDVIARIDSLVRENRRITEEQIRVQVGISHGSVHAIITDHLQFRKICAKCVPQQLTEGQRIDRMAACLSFAAVPPGRV